MSKIRLLVAMFVMACALSACATLQKKSSNDPDRIAQDFLYDLQKSDRQAAYGLFAKGLSQTISFDQFDDLISSMEKPWGRMVDYDTALLPFHQRSGESNFIPFGIPKEKIKRYTYEIQYFQKNIYCDLTLAPQEGQYKIIWISFWGSSVDLTPTTNNPSNSKV